jgi:asparagine synthase (glutamine-hydrolysing)
MCGIFFYQSDDSIKKTKKILKQFNRIKSRGPDVSNFRLYNENVAIGFHRLAIVDTSTAGEQPFEYDNCFVCVVNGEIYNYKQIIEDLKDKNPELKLQSGSDCEVILPLLSEILKSSEKEDSGFHNKKRNVYDAIKILVDKLDGEFAFIIYDTITKYTYFAVDQLRVRPLFLGKKYGKFGIQEIYLASEQKSLLGCDNILPVPSGHIGWIDPSNNYSFDQYYNFSEINPQISFEDASRQLRNLLINNVKNKLNPERDFGFLLSGGLDSSLICAIAARLLSQSSNSNTTRIRTFCVGFDENASDIIAARKVAQHINSIHTELIFSYEDGINLLKDVIYSNESYDQTTTRASIPMMLAVRAIKKFHPEIAVIYSGEMSDELFMGYLEWQNAPNAEEARNHVMKRLRDITYFDGLRADRIVSSVGCELRLPFFSKDILNFVLSLPPEYLMPQTHNGTEKFLLRKAFSIESGDFGESPQKEDSDFANLLPDSILWRVKHAFSDATSIVGKTSWKEYLKNYAENMITDSRFNCRNQIYFHNIPQTKEDMLYRDIFENFGYYDKCIPYKWLPNWAPEDLTDASATALSSFKESTL